MVEVRRVVAPAADGLIPWAVGTFHATAAIIAIGGVAILGDALVRPLDGFGSLPGVVAIAILCGYTWGVVWWTTGRWLTQVGEDPFGPTTSENALVASAVLWGGATGLLVFVPSFGVGLLVAAAAGASGGFALVVLSAAVAAAAAAAAGAVLWGVLALVDLACLRLARAWLPSAAD